MIIKSHTACSFSNTGREANSFTAEYAHRVPGLATASRQGALYLFFLLLEISEYLFLFACIWFTVTSFS